MRAADTTTSLQERENLTHFFACYGGSSRTYYLTHKRKEILFVLIDGFVKYGVPAASLGPLWVVNKTF